MTSAGPEAGWYFDPGDRTCERFWNGAAWTEHSRPVPSAPDPFAADPFAPKSVMPATDTVGAEPPSPRGPPVYTVAAYAEPPPESAPVAPPQGSSTSFRLGGWAQVVVGDKRYLGRVGQIAAIDSNRNAELRFKGSLGTYAFRLDHLAAAPPPA